MKKIIIDETTQNQRFDKYLKRYLPNAGTGFLYKMLREKKIKLNGKKSDGKDILRSGDEITIFFSDDTMAKFMGAGDEQNRQAPASDKAVQKFKDHIIYEDKDVVMINKPAGMLSQKAKPDDVSACELLVSYMIAEKQIDPENLNQYKPSAVNRLDRNTSGILVCAKTLRAAQKLSEMFRDRNLKKEYRALVSGRVEKEYHVKAYLKKNDADNKVQVTEQPKEGFDRIETAYSPIGYLDNATLLNVDLLTGKTHQIRAHLSYMGNPIIGDTKYGNRKTDRRFKEKYGLRRQFLHAFRLTFPSLDGCLGGLSGRSFTAELPEDLIAIEKDVKYVNDERAG